MICIAVIRFRRRQDVGEGELVFEETGGKDDVETHGSVLDGGDGDGGRREGGKVTRGILFR